MKNKKQIILFHIFVNILTVCIGEEFEKPPFLPGPPDPRVTFGVYEEDGHLQRIYMEEEIEGEITVAYINYKGSTAPVLSEIIPGVNEIVGVIIKRDNEEENYALVVTKTIDYEALKNYYFAFQIDLEGNTQSEYFTLFIVNIDDNAPEIVPEFKGSCFFEENKIGRTNCSYKIYDDDGSITTTKYEVFDKEGSETSKFFYVSTPYNVSPNNKAAYVTLDVIQELNYQETPIFMVSVKVTDAGGNIGDPITTIFRVIDLPDTPPIWTRVFASAEIIEKKHATFTVEAIDGDTGINAEIHYKIIEADDKYFSVDRETGVINISPIDRDKFDDDNNQKSMFKFTIQAYEKDNVTSEITQTIIIIVLDINDNSPTFSPSGSLSISIPEEKYQTLVFDTDIEVTDPDYADNGTFTIQLIDKGNLGFDWYKAFSILPEKGYQTTKLSISVKEADLIDYEDENWQSFTLQLIATEISDSSHVGTLDIHIDLQNWNDEEPIFDPNDIPVSIEETVGNNYKLGTVKATDRDIGDFVSHTLASFNGHLKIDEEFGIITTARENFFDYETQPEVKIQVKAIDTLNNSNLHTSFATLTVTVIDINDETPQLNLPIESPSVSENVEKGYEIKDTVITATDPDGDAHLEFSIDWENTVATKQGRIANKTEYENCFDIKTVYGEREGDASAILVVQEIRPGVTIDYEMFDVINLYITVTDTNQVVNAPSRSGKWAINIIDVNDNAPEFDDTTLEQTLIVKDKETENSIIGNVYATDKDSPPHNDITYFIKDINNTKSESVQINAKNGFLSVNKDDIINADYPEYTEYLFFTVYATDNLFTTPLDIKIYIKDINDQRPHATESENCEISEGAEINEKVQTIFNAFDEDRDDNFKRILYTLSYVPSDDKFQINEDTGEIFVKNKLDRDHGTTQYEFTIKLRDNPEGPGVQNTGDPATFIVKLLDVNDNAPRFDFENNTDLETSIDERLKKNDAVFDLFAEDIDEPNTVNSKVEYEITKVWKDNDDEDLKLFAAKSLNDTHGQIIAAKDLKDYYGYFWLTIVARDFGEPRLHSTVNVRIYVAPFNFESPKIIFPKQKDKIRLRLDSEINSPLITFPEEKELEPFSATDGHDNTKFDITFQLYDDSDIFALRTTINKNTAVLRLKADRENIQYELAVIATDNGNPPKSSEIHNFTVTFIDANTPPVFDSLTYNTDFTENKTGLNEKREFPPATDPKIEEGIPGEYKVYYHIFNGDHPEYFAIKDKTKNELTLADELDREVKDSHWVQIVACNNDEACSKNPNPQSLLNISIEVNDVNDNWPVFTDTYNIGVTTDYKPNDKLLQFSATDADKDDIVTYYFVENSFVTSDPSLNELTNKFVLDEITGIFQLNFRVQSEMKGHLDFKVEARDLVNHSTVVPAKVFIIAKSNIVVFSFNNKEEELQEIDKSTFEEIFGEAYDHVCVVDEITKYDDDGTSHENQTFVKTHFMKDDVAVPSSDINVYDTRITNKLKLTFLGLGLDLMDAENINEQNIRSLERLFRTILIIVSVVLGTLCIVLFVALFFRTRSLTNRLDALTTTKFASQDSGLNRIGVPAPNTNIFSVEGSNPLHNTDKNYDFDRRSVSSDGSDLIGIEENPEFDYDDEMRRSSFNPVLHNEIRRKSLNPMAQDTNNIGSDFTPKY